MRDTEPLISIIVATKDRYETLFDCIDGLLINYDSAQVEILVRDNSATPRAAECERAFGTKSNVRYWHDPTPVSQSENYELAIEQATGRYVTMIGDDDGISGGLVAVVQWMDRHSIDAFFPGFSVYLWPGVNQRYAGPNDSGVLSWQKVDAGPRLVSADAQRRAVLAGGCTSLEDLPRLYYGLVSRYVLQQLKDKTGAYFPGPSPDMANAFSLSYYVPRFMVGNLPIFIAGNSRKSNAGLGLRAQHVGEIAHLSFLPKDTATHWNPSIPFFWSGQTIWCQSAYTAAMALDRADDFDRENNYRRLYARLLVFQPNYASRTFSALRHRHRNRPALARWLELAATLGRAGGLAAGRVVSFAIRRAKALRGNDHRITQVQGVANVSAATRAVDAHLREIDLERLLDQGLTGDR